MNCSRKIHVSALCWTLAAVTLVSIDISATCGQEPTSDKTALQAKSAVLDYIEQFKSDDLVKRDLAERKLIALGQVALPTIRDQFDSGALVGEVELRVSRVLKELERGAIERSLEPSSITLQGELPLEQILLAISSQTNNKVKLENSETEAQPVLVDFTSVPFWEVIDTLCEDANLDVVTFGESDQLTLRSTGDYSGFRLVTGQYSGPFRTETVSATATRSFNNPVYDSLRVGIQLAWEPRLQPLLIELDKQSITAECDDNTIIESLEQRPQEISLSQSSVAEFEVALKLPPREATAINRLTGTMSVTVPGEPTPVRFRDLTAKKPIERRIGDIVASIEDVRENGEITQVDLLLKLGESNMRLDSFRNWLLLNEAYALGPDGTRQPNLGWQTYLMNDQEVGITVNFSVETELKDYQFVFEAPAALLEHRIDFLLEDIPLP